MTCLRRKRRSTILLFSGLCSDAVLFLFFQTTILLHHQRKADRVPGRKTVSALQNCQVSTSPPPFLLVLTPQTCIFSFFFSFESILQYLICSTYTGVDTWVIGGCFQLVTYNIHSDIFYSLILSWKPSSCVVDRR